MQGRLETLLTLPLLSAPCLGMAPLVFLPD